MNLFFIFQNYVNEKYPTILESEIKEFWTTNPVAAQFGSTKVIKRRKTNYGSIVTDNLILTKFACDLFTVPEPYQERLLDRTQNPETINYILLIVCEVSKYCFAQFLKTKDKASMQHAFLQIIK